MSSATAKSRPGSTTNMGILRGLCGPGWTGRYGTGTYKLVHAAGIVWSDDYSSLARVGSHLDGGRRNGAQRLRGRGIAVVIAASEGESFCGRVQEVCGLWNLDRVDG